MKITQGCALRFLDTITGRSADTTIYSPVVEAFVSGFFGGLGKSVPQAWMWDNGRNQAPPAFRGLRKDFVAFLRAVADQLDVDTEEVDQ